MKHKTSQIRRIVVLALTILCMISAFSSLLVGAVTGTLSNGYTVSSTAGINGKTASGTGQVTNGGPCSISITVYPFRNYNGEAIRLSGKSNSGYSTLVSKSVPTSYTLCGATCYAYFNTEGSYTGTYGYYWT